MTGPEHYAKAEECLAEAEDQDLGSRNEAWLMAKAQLHATLALAAATAAGPKSTLVWSGVTTK